MRWRRTRRRRRRVGSAQAEAFLDLTCSNCGGLGHAESVCPSLPEEAEVAAQALEALGAVCWAWRMETRRHGSHLFCCNILHRERWARSAARAERKQEGAGCVCSTAAVCSGNAGRCLLRAVSGNKRTRVAFVLLQQSVARKNMQEREKTYKKKKHI